MNTRFLRYSPVILAVAILLHYVGSLHELEETLVVHVLGQHSLFLAGGYLLAMGFEDTILYSYKASGKAGPGLAMLSFLKTLIRFYGRVNPHGATSTTVFGALVVAWHTPTVFNLFVSSEGFHILMHATFSFMGVLAYLSAKVLYTRLKIVLLLVAAKSAIIYGFFLTITGQYLFTVYPFPEQPQLGISMILSMLFIELGMVPYLIYRRYFVGA